MRIVGPSVRTKKQCLRHSLIAIVENGVVKTEMKEERRNVLDFPSVRSLPPREGHVDFPLRRGRGAV